jgi:hypothetical protein
VVVFDNTYKMNRYGMSYIPFIGLNNHRNTTCIMVSNEKVKPMFATSNISDCNVSEEAKGCNP